MTKKCYICQNNLNIGSFGKNKTKFDGLTSECKNCKKQLDRKYYINNKHKWAERDKKLRLKDPELFKIKTKEAQARYRANPDNTIRLRYIKKRFGIDIDQYVKMELEQNGCCAICEHKPDLSKNQRLHIDHDHLTNKIRKLLCFNCNSMLGHAKDNIEVLLKSIEYLSLFNS